MDTNHYKACDGNPTVDDPDNYGMVKCIHCEKSVLEEYCDHPFWGFQNCEEKGRNDE